MAAKRAVATAQTKKEDLQRSIEDWKLMDNTSLRLKCNIYNLTVSGKKIELATRLFEYFNEVSDGESSEGSEGTASPKSRNREDSDHERDHEDSPYEREDGEVTPSESPDYILDDELEMQNLLAPTGEFDLEDDHVSVRKTSNVLPLPRRQNQQQQPIKVNQNGGPRPLDQSDGTPSASWPIPALGAKTQQQAALEIMQHEIKAVRSEVINVKNKNKQLEASLLEAQLQKQRSNRSPSPAQRRLSAPQRKQHSPSPAHRRSSAKRHRRSPSPKKNNSSKRPSSVPSGRKTPKIQPNSHNQNKRSTHPTPSKSSKNDRNHSPPHKQRKSNKSGPTDDENNANDNHSKDDLLYQKQMRLALELSQQQSQTQPTANTTSRPRTSANSITTHQPTTGMSSLDISDPWASFRNPFTPPALSETQFKKIEERKFVDFTDLLPENQASDITITNDRHTIDIDEHTGLLRHKDKKTKAKATSFHRWSTAWCIFAQAHLHFHPEDYFELFKYHSIMVQNVNRYKFEACYQYDRDFRLRIQHERNLPYEHRTVHWSRESDELRNLHLVNNPVPICENCNTPGHTVKLCRKNMNNYNNNNNNYNSNYNSNYNNKNNNQNQQMNTPQNLQRFNQQSPFRGPQNFQQFNQQSSFRGPQNNSSRPKSTPPNQKYCFRFAQGAPCSKPPCMFLHMCERCGDLQHGSLFCDKQTSTNFIPTSHH